MAQVASQQDLIHVEEAVSEEIKADHAELFVTIRGTSFVAGTAALTKAREVSQLVADLQQAGVSESDIHVQDVQAEVSTGVLGRNSSANYKLRVECKTLEKLTGVLGAITAQKNTTLNHLRWLYPDSAAARNQLLQRCVERANEVARLIAASLGVKLIGISSLQYRYSNVDTAALARLRSGATMRRSRDAYKEEEEDMSEAFNVQVSHTKELLVSVSVAYRISEIEN